MHATPCCDAVTVSIHFVEAKMDIARYGTDINNYGADFINYENRQFKIMSRASSLVPSMPPNKSVDTYLC